MPTEKREPDMNIPTPVCMCVAMGNADDDIYTPCCVDFEYYLQTVMMPLKKFPRNHNALFLPHAHSPLSPQQTPLRRHYT